MSNPAQHSPHASVSTEEDVIVRALEPEQLGPQADADTIRKWGGWIYPLVPLSEDDFEEKVEELRKKIISAQCKELQNDEK